jgi:predicted TIM-barrel fold metal-dependent hydrolase
MDRLLIVSGDAHIGGRPDMYADYLEPEFRDAIVELDEENQAFTGMAAMGREMMAKMEAPPEMDGATVPHDDEFPGWNVARRLKDLDREGVTAEVLHGGHQGSVLPFYSVMNKPYPADVRFAGSRAFHRWVADCIGESKGRMFGIADPGPCLDMDATVAELRWAADHGFVGVSLPQNTYNEDLPPVHDAYYEPIWAACEELGLALSVHAGWGSKQGKFMEFAAQFGKLVVGSTRSDEEMAGMMMEAMASDPDSPLKLDMGPRRALWQLMLGGVFDRHPQLKLVLTEVRADWVPATLDILDQRCDELAPKMKLKPSEYWKQNCFATPSSPHKCELEMRHDIGVEQFIFGTDYPHPEGTWPQTRDWIRYSFAGVPEDEARIMLADNAIRAYNLDRSKLEPIAAKIGPEPADVLGTHDVDEVLLEAFDKRAGLRRPAEEADRDSIVELLDEDLTAVGASR